MIHVLIVEDREADRKLLKMRLERNGYRVTAAGDGVEALAAARRDPPDAIVSDGLMPKMDGFALCRAWMQDGELKAIPFIFYSATYARAEGEHFAIALGAVRYLIKPMEEKAFLRELRTVLQQWAGHAAPAPAPPLDDATYHTLHESALARKLDDKIAQLEAALLDSEDKYRSIYNNLQDVYVEVTLEGTILEMSPQVETLSRGQYKREDLIGTSVNVLYADPRYREALLLAVKEHSRAIDMESVFRNRDGSLIPCSISSTIVRGADGKLKSVATLRDITERKRIEDALHNSEAELKAAQRVARIGNWHLDLTTGTVSWSEEIYRVFGCDPELPPPTYAEHGQILTVTSTERLNAAVENSKQTGAPFEIDLEVLRADGTSKWIAALGEAVRDDNGKIVALRGTAQDISERKEAEDAVRKSNRALRALSSCNRALIRVNEEQQLFEDICQIIVIEGGFRLAWVGIAEQDADKSVRPVAQRGYEEGYLNTLKITWADTDRGRGPTGTAIRTGYTQVNQNFATNPRVAPWREDALKHGYHSSVALPLKSAAAVLGALTIYAVEPNAFDAEEVKLLEELADDLAFGITVLRGKAAHIGAEIALRNSEEKFKKISSSAQDAIILMDHEGKVAFWNDAAQRMYGYVEEDIIGQVLHQMLVPERYREEYEPGMRQFFATGEGPILGKPRELMARRKDGAEFPVEMIVSGIQINGKWHAAAMVRDITERKQAEQALRTSEWRFKTMFVQAPLGIALIDSLTGHIYEANPRFAEIAGRSMEEMANIDWLQITHPDDVQADLDNMALLNAGKINGFQMEKRYLQRDGSAVWINMTIAPLKVEDAAHPRHLCMIQDITERKVAERTIVHLNRVYAVLSGINALIVRVHDRDELFREACRIAAEGGGFRMSLIAIVDRSAMKIVPVASAGTDEALLTAIKGILSSSERAATTMSARAIREKKAVVSNDSQSDPKVFFGKQYAEFGVRSIAIFPLIVSDEAVGVLALYASESEFFQEEELKLLTELAGDIAFAIDHIEKRERLDYLAYYDVLTGLANRTLFLERVAQYMRSAASGGHKLAVFLIDLERFKNINDSLGRPAGDTLLRQVAEWLTRNAGDANLVARVGADHFAVALPEVKQEGGVVRLLEKTMEAFRDHPFCQNDAVFRIAFKAGVTLFPDDGADADTLFKNAEAALKKAKASGDRYLFYTQSMTEAVAGKLTLENQLRQALDKGEFVLHYQPKVNLASGKLTSAEALIRWNDPRTGLVPPGRFIPILEETGLIYEVGRWALRKAIEEHLRWRSAGLAAVRIAVNVSPLQLRNPGFIAEITQAIGIDAHAAAGLELEITESLIMEDVKHNIAILQAIRAMGVSIAIDDFGTGFSSLSYLAKLPVDTLKIDRSFVIDMTAAPEGLALVSTIITLAHSLKLKVVAEGVETEEQSRLLRLLGCDEMQGFLFSKPVPSEIFEIKFLAPPAAG